MTHPCIAAAITTTLTLGAGAAWAGAPIAAQHDASFNTECSLARVEIDLAATAPDLNGAQQAFESQVQMEVGCIAGLTTRQGESIHNQIYDDCLAARGTYQACDHIADELTVLASQYNQQMSPQIPLAIHIDIKGRPGYGLEPMLTARATHTLGDETREDWDYVLRRSGEFAGASRTYTDNLEGLRLGCDTESAAGLTGTIHRQTGRMEGELRVYRAVSCADEGLSFEADITYATPVFGYIQ